MLKCASIVGARANQADLADPSAVFHSYGFLMILACREGRSNKPGKPTGLTQIPGSIEYVAFMSGWFSVFNKCPREIFKIILFVRNPYYICSPNGVKMQLNAAPALGAVS